MNTIVMIVAALAALNLLSFGLMVYDKRCAKADKRRVPEKVLILAAACFGALGGVLGMQLCRHKTRHWCICRPDCAAKPAKLSMRSAGIEQWFRAN